MGKFKVGDKVKVRNIKVGTTSHSCMFAPEMSEYAEKKFTIAKEFIEGIYMFEDLEYFWAEDWLEPANPETIVIYRAGDKTIALDKRTGKKAEAKCSKEDTYDFYAGAKIPFERLIDEDTAKEEPKPKLYNGKVVCVKSLCNNLTKGKIYEFKDGYSKYDNGDPMPKYCDAVTSFEDLKSTMGDNFVELDEKATDDVKLKPCPFCGAEAVIMGKRAIYIMCKNYKCMARTDRGRLYRPAARRNKQNICYYLRFKRLGLARRLRRDRDKRGKNNEVDKG